MTTTSDSMMFGIHTIPTDETIHPARLGPALEERGFTALFVADHSHIPTGSATPYPRGGELPRQYSRVLDPFVTLGLVSAVTEHLLLGTGVALVVQRDPIQTAKEVASLDFLSGGRVILGVGAGWNREEMRNHGTDPRTRGALLDERLTAMIEIWTKDEAEFHGEHVDFGPIAAWPKPARQPRPPIYVGGGSARAIARATRFGGWMPSATGLTDPAKIADLIAAAGPGVPVILNGLAPAPETIAACRDAGATGITFHLPPASEADALRMLDDWAGLIG